MPEQPALGRLERVDLRSAWISEATSFTPWLATSDNLKLLGDAIGIDLEFEGSEQSVGPFRADILCKDIGRDSWVLVENQLEKTDHKHLGQVLTYAAGLDAVTIVWIAANFTNEHRATLDWLNRVTDDDFSFFGIEVELWRIGESLAAPKFNVISKPNTWTKAVKSAAKSIDETALTDWQKMQLKYWDQLLQTANTAESTLNYVRKAQPRSWMSFASGMRSITFSVAMNRFNSEVRAELYLSGKTAGGYFDQLMAHKSDIERNVEFPLTWLTTPSGRDRKIYASLEVLDFENEADWPRQHAWIVARLEALNHAFGPHLQELDDSFPSDE